MYELWTYIIHKSTYWPFLHANDSGLFMYLSTVIYILNYINIFKFIKPFPSISKDLDLSFQ